MEVSLNDFCQQAAGSRTDISQVCALSIFMRILIDLRQDQKCI